MLTKDFAYTLPDELIARFPTAQRSGSRLLLLDPNACADQLKLKDQQFNDLPNLLQPGDLLVLNDSKVLKARLFGHKASGGKIEILIERILDNNMALAHVRASKIPKANSELIVGDNIQIKVLQFDTQKSLFLLQFPSTQPITDVLDQHGLIPLPPYFNRDAENSDLQRYQTVYAVNPGSVAAPTAGLHFTPELLQQIQNNGVNIAKLTLHVGAGTFQPVRVANIADHKMHSELMQISAQLCEQIAITKQNGGRVIAVGTTAVRALESAANNAQSGGDHLTLKPQTRDTDIFITPGYKFKIVDAMITNFHLPESTLLMLVCAFAGTTNIFNAYQHAIKHNYRFYSYGDAMFITRQQDAI